MLDHVLDATEAKTSPVRLEALELEQQPPHDVVFPLRDPLFKARFRIVASRRCTVLAHRHEVVLSRRHYDGNEQLVTLAAYTNDAKVRPYREHRWPYELEAGEAREHWMVATNIDIPGRLQRLGYRDPIAALATAELRFFVRIAIEVAGKASGTALKVPFRVALARARADT